jgi:hypothetical protein
LNESLFSYVFAEFVAAATARRVHETRVRTPRTLDGRARQARIKDDFGARRIHMRDRAKVLTQLMFGILAMRWVT